MTAETQSMGARIIQYGRNGARAARRRKEIRAIATIICAVGLPLILAFILIAADMRTDLSDLIPSEALSEPSTTLIGWRDLEIPDWPVRVARTDPLATATASPNAPVICWTVSGTA